LAKILQNGINRPIFAGFPLKMNFWGFAQKTFPSKFARFGVKIRISRTRIFCSADASCHQFRQLSQQNVRE
jgi:hypothetical protein